MHRLLVVSVVVVAGCKSRGSTKGEPAPEPTPAGSAGSAALGGEPLPPELQQDIAKLAAAEQATAKQARGTITIARAWRSERGPKLAAGRAWVLVDVNFGTLAIDTDDLELVDVDRRVASAIGDVRRLDTNGQLVALAGAHGHENHFLLGFETAADTKRVGLYYWGEMLTAAPVEIAANGPEFAEEKREIVRHFAKGKRHLLVFEDHNMEDPPSSLTSHVGYDGGECAMTGMVRVSAGLTVLEPALDAFAPHALYLADFTCAQPPTQHGYDNRPLPRVEAWAVPDATAAALEGRGPGLVTLATGEGFPEVAARADGSLIAIASPKQDIRLVDATGTDRGRLPWRRGELTKLGFTPDGTRLWGVEDDGEVAVWDVIKAKTIATRKLEPEPDMYCRAQLSPDGQWLVVDTPWTRPGEIRVAWSGQLTLFAMPDLSKPVSVKLIDGNEGSIVDLAFAPDSKRLVVCATTKTESLVRVYGVPRGDQQVAIKSSTSRAASCAIAHDGSILVGTEGSGVEIYDRTGKKRSTIAVNASVAAIEPRADGTFVTGGSDGRALAWKGGKSTELARHRYPVHELRSAGDSLATKAPYDATIIVGGKLVKRLFGSADGPHAFAVAPGLLVVSELAIGAKSSRVRIWRQSD